MKKILPAVLLYAESLTTHCRWFKAGFSTVILDRIFPSSRRQSLHISQRAHRVVAYPTICRMNGLEMFLLDGMLVHRRVTAVNYPFVYLGGERHCESKVSCPRTQRMHVPGLGSNSNHSIHKATALFLQLRNIGVSSHCLRS